MCEAHLQTVRQLFDLDNQYMRWELNDLARRLDEQPPAVPGHEVFVIRQRVSPDVRHL